MAREAARPVEELQEALEGEFQVVRLLGAGKVASVYLARELSLQREVALKIMHPSVAGDETTRRRFEREARAVAALSQHPCIVSIHRFGRLPDGSPYLVMQYVKGRTMRELLKAEGRLPVERALETLRAVAGALSLAHSKGIVHRDVRPGNVLWDEVEEQALLTDFGLVALVDSAADSTRLTRAGELLGDPSHLSPEVLLDQDVTEMADVYGFGILGYELFTGEGPYDARNTTEMVKAHLSGEPRDLKALRPDVPDHVVALLGRCLAKEPKHRPSSADLVRLLAGPAREASSSGGQQQAAGGWEEMMRKRVPQVVATTAGAAVVVAGVLGDAMATNSYRAVLVLMVTAVAVSAVIAWFHGEQGKQRAPVLEYLLVAVIAVAGVALAAWFYLGG